MDHQLKYDGLLLGKNLRYSFFKTQHFAFDLLSKSKYFSSNKKIIDSESAAKIELIELMNHHLLN